MFASSNSSVQLHRKRSWGLEKQGYYGKVYILPSDKVMSYVHKDWKKAPDVSRKRKKICLFTG
jgi:hypothetical protein